MCTYWSPWMNCLYFCPPTFSAFSSFKPLWDFCVLVLFWETFLQAFPATHFMVCYKSVKVCRWIVSLLLVYWIPFFLFVFPSHWPLCFFVPFSFCFFSNCVIVVSFTVFCPILYHCFSNVYIAVFFTHIYCLYFFNHCAGVVEAVLTTAD